MSIRTSWQGCAGTQLTFVFPSSCEEKSMWNGRFEDFMISSCNRVDPFASTTLSVLKGRVSRLLVDAFLHEVFLPQPFKPRCHIRPPFTLVPLQLRSNDSTLSWISLTCLLMPSSNELVSHPVIPLCRRCSPGKQQPVQHPPMRNINVFNSLRSLPSHTCLCKEANAPVGCKLW